MPRPGGEVRASGRVSFWVILHCLDQRLEPYGYSAKNGGVNSYSVARMVPPHEARADPGGVLRPTGQIGLQNRRRFAKISYLPDRRVLENSNQGRSSREEPKGPHGCAP
jgi:hypothetical protein